jgi:hypothetical protein
MATEAQIAANRRNAQHSSGPKTGAGREKSAQNALKFGLFSRHVLLPGEDESELAQLRDGIRARLKPADALEEIYVERIISSSWRLQRALAGEKTIFAQCEKYTRLPSPQTFGDSDGVNDLNALQKHIAALERSIDKAVSELAKLQKARPNSPEEDRNDENEPNSDQTEEVSGSMPIQIVKTNPIATASEAPIDAIDRIEENEPNPLALQAPKAHGSAVGPLSASAATPDPT